MDGHPAGLGLAEPPPHASVSRATWAALALLAHVALLDAAVETYWFASPYRWWIAPLFLLTAAVSAWLWRPGGHALARFGAAPAAATPVIGLLLGIAITVWLPGGREGGVRLLLQPTSTLLSAVTMFGIAVGGVAWWRASAVLAVSARRLARTLFVALGCYAIFAFAIGARDRVPFAELFQGGAEWTRLPWFFQGAAIGGLLLVPLGLVGATITAARSLGVARLLRGPIASMTALVLVLAIALSGLPRADQKRSAPAADDLYAAIGGEAWPLDKAAANSAAGIRYLLDQFAILQSEVPKESFDPAALGAGTDAAPEAAFAWVRDHTFWVPYRGLLRGARGVLMDRLGNSLDRSILLAALLRRSGREVRFAQATLTNEQARALLARARAVPDARHRVPDDPPGWTARQDEVVAGYAAKFSRAPGVLLAAMRQYQHSHEPVNAAARKVAHGQAAALASAVRQRAPSQPPDQALAAAADHWWVQYNRDGVWVDLDPTPGDAAEGQAPVTEPARFFDEPPDESRWFVAISVVVERWSGGGLSEEVVLTDRLPAADVAWQDITLSHSPVGLPLPEGDNRDAATVRSTALDARRWVPVLTIGKRQVTGSSFGDDAGVHQRPGEEAETTRPDASGGLGGGDDAPAPAREGVLTAEWVDYEIQGPGAEPRRSRRESFDLVGPHARASRPSDAPVLDENARARRGLVLLGQTSIRIQVSRPTRAFIANRMLERFNEHRDALLQLAALGRQSKRGDLDKLFYDLAPQSDVLWGVAARRFEVSDVADAVFLDTPNVLTLRQEILAEAGQPMTARTVFDLVVNSVSALPAETASAFSKRVEQGVADTFAEALETSVSIGNVPAVFGGARAAGIGARLVSGDPSGSSLGPGLPPDVLARAGADLSSGHCLVMPERPVLIRGVPSFGWWRVEMETGTTVGVMDTGFHQGYTEFQMATAVAATALGVYYIDHAWDYLQANGASLLVGLGLILIAIGQSLGGRQVAKSSPRHYPDDFSQWSNDDFASLMR